MIAYKGFSSEITSVMGNGRKEDCTFQVGHTYTAPGAKTAREGYHCCEYIMDCMRYYQLDGKNRFFVVDAGGDIDEDDHRIACTKITLLRELDVRTVALEAMQYMYSHPDRGGWSCTYLNAVVAPERAELFLAGIAIARGADPHIKAPEGTVAGLLVEEDGKIVNASLFRVNSEQANKWIRLTPKGLAVVE